MKTLEGPRLWNACTGILGCNWYKKYMSSQPVIFTSFFRGDWVVCLMPTEVSFQRWRKLPFEFLNIFLKLFLVRARHFVCYAYNHPVFIILRVLFFEHREKAYNSPYISDAKPEKNRQKCPNLKIVPGHTCMYNTHAMLQKQSFECTRVLIF